MIAFLSIFILQVCWEPTENIWQLTPWSISGFQHTNVGVFVMEWQTCQPVRILRSGHAFWPQSTQVRFVTLNYAKTWWRLCARTVAYLNHATATKEDFDQSERWVHSPSNMWDDWQMRNVRPIIKKRLQIDSKTKSRSVSRLFTPAVWFLKRGQYTRYLQLR